MSATTWAAFPTTCLAESRYDCALPSAVLLFPRTPSPTFCVADFSDSGWTSAATLSAAPVMVSDATWVYVFCDCGVTFSETWSPSPFLLLLLVRAQWQRKWSSAYKLSDIMSDFSSFFGFRLSCRDLLSRWFGCWICEEGSLIRIQSHLLSLWLHLRHRGASRIKRHGTTPYFLIYLSICTKTRTPGKHNSECSLEWLEMVSHKCSEGKWCQNSTGSDVVI